MKRLSLIIMILCSAWFTGCNKDDNGQDMPVDNSVISLMDGSIFINSHPDVKISSLNEFPEGASTTSDKSTGVKRSGIKSTAENEPAHNLQGNDYRFKLVAQMSTLKIYGVEVQATHVKISDDGYAFVSYNEKGEPHRGGVVIYKFKVHDGSLEEVKVNVTAVSSMEMTKAELSALDYYDGKLYMTGASSERNFGYNSRIDGYNYAFFMVMDLNTDKTFKDNDPKAIVKLSSFQGTSIRVHKGLTYITTGDGTNGTKGGLYIYDANDYTLVNSILGIEHARSVDVDDNYIYLMQANHARVTKYNLDGTGETVIYDAIDEAMQRDAKSEMLAWDNYLFVAENESGLRMLFKNNGDVNAALDRPGEDTENDVTNSVSMNSDPKKDENGKMVQSNLLLLANGVQGIYWYDIIKDDNGKDWIVSSNDNSILGGTGSANFITSKGNIVFLADGLGGLKVLYVGFNSGDIPPPISGDGCQDFMSYLYNGTNQVTMLFPETRSVFRSNAHPIVKQLFQLPSVQEAANVTLNYIDVINETPLYITYMSEGAGFNNALGYFEIPAEVERTDKAEFDYWNTNIKPDMYTTAGRANVLKDKYIVFKNIRDNSKGGKMVAGNTYQIGGDKKTFKAGTRVVLFMCPDGWSPQNNRVEVTFNTGTYKQIFFMHKGFNKETNIPYASGYGNFAGVQFMSFYSADCNSMVLTVEDIHIQHQYSDVDFNDVIFSVSDNLTHGKIMNFKSPKWAVGEKIDGNEGLVILPTEDILKTK